MCWQAAARSLPAGGYVVVLALRAVGGLLVVILVVVPLVAVATVVVAKLTASVAAEQAGGNHVAGSDACNANLGLNICFHFCLIFEGDYLMIIFLPFTM